LREDLDEARLFPPAPAIAADQRQMPDWGWVHRELRRPNVTLALLWEEYRASAPPLGSAIPGSATCTGAGRAG
jgi:transposase